MAKKSTSEDVGEVLALGEVLRLWDGTEVTVKLHSRTAGTVVAPKAFQGREVMRTVHGWRLRQ